MAQLGFMPLGGDHEFTWDHISALMDQLVKRMLTVGAWFTPHNRARRDIQRLAIHADPLAIAFHFELLEIGRQPAQPFIIGQDRARAIATDLSVPKPNQRQHQWHVFRALRALEMDIHRLATTQERIKRVRADRNHQAKTDRAPHRVAPADPILEPKNPRHRNTEFAGFLLCTGQGSELDCPDPRRDPSSMPVRCAHWSWFRS